MQISRESGLFSIIDLIIVVVSLALSQFNIENPTFILIYVTLSYSVMIYSLHKKYKRWFAFDLVYIIITYVFYFGQYIELAFTGKVINDSLSITKSYDISYMNKIAMYVVVYVAVLHIAFLIYKPKGAEQRKVIDLNYSKGRFIVWGIYIFSLPFGCYYEYTRARYSSLYGYGATLYANLASSSSLLRIAEYVSGFVISMFILLLILEEKRKLKWILLLSMVPYLFFYISVGSRLRIGLLAITMAFVYLFWYRRGKKFEIKSVVLAVVIALVMLYLFALMASVRNYLGIYGSFMAALKEAAANTSIVDGVLHAFDEFGCQIVSVAAVFKNCPNNVDYNNGKLFLYGIEIIIPNLFGYQRIFYTDNTDIAFKGFLNNGNTGVGSSFISESYYCFGFFGILLVFALGLLMEKVTYKLMHIDEMQPYKAFSYFYLVYLLIFTVRSDMFVMPSSYFQYCFFPILIIWLTRKTRVHITMRTTD